MHKSELHLCDTSHPWSGFGQKQELREALTMRYWMNPEIDILGQTQHDCCDHPEIEELREASQRSLNLTNQIRIYPMSQIRTYPMKLDSSH